MKRISLDVSDNGANIVVTVTFPLPLLGTYKTVDVAITDDLAKELIAKVQGFLDARGARRLHP